MKSSRKNPPSAGDRGGDVSVRAFLYVVLGLALMIGIALVGNRVLFDLFQAREMLRDTPATPFDEVRPEFPDPMLQVDPAADLDALDAEMDAALGTYEWVDPDGDRVRIPIERAMDLAAERGLPELSQTGEGGTP